jgi:hypothetical protein
MRTEVQAMTRKETLKEMEALTGKDTQTLSSMQTQALTAKGL